LGKLVSILIRKWRGQWSARDEEKLQELLGRKEDQEAYSAYQKTWQASQFYRQTYEPDVESGWKRFQREIQPQPGPGPVWRWGLVAVLVLVLAALGFWLMKDYFRSEDIRKQPALDVVAESLEVHYLVDSSTVMLNTNSRLEILKQESGEIVLELHGEGYFHVQPNPDRAFVIYAGGAKVEVIGTAFNLRSVPEEAFTEIEVEEGEVTFTDLQTREIKRVRQNERAVCSPQNGLQKSDAPNLNAHAWRTGIMIWEDSPLPEIVMDLEHFYGVRIDLDENMPALDCEFSNKVDRSFEIQAALTRLAGFHDIEFERLADDHYRLYGGESCSR